MLWKSSDRLHQEGRRVSYCPAGIVRWLTSLSPVRIDGSESRSSGRGAIHSWIDVASFPFCADKDDYLLFLGRISLGKGVHHAIDVARRLGRRRIVASKVDRVDRTYVSRPIKPTTDGRLITFVGEAEAEQKRALLAGAEGLLNPITWSEPFGLVMVEAMTCGTRVIAFNRGSAPELIVYGETRYIVHDVDGTTQTVFRFDRIDPASCRQHTQANFDTPRTVDGYLAVYRKVRSNTAGLGKGRQGDKRRA